MKRPDEAIEVIDGDCYSEDRRCYVDEIFRYILHLEQRIKEQDKLLRKLRKIYLYDINFESKDGDGIKTPLMEAMSTWDEVNKILNQSK